MQLIDRFPVPPKDDPVVQERILSPRLRDPKLLPQSADDSTAKNLQEFEGQAMTFSSPDFIKGDYERVLNASRGALSGSELDYFLEWLLKTPPDLHARYQRLAHSSLMDSVQEDPGRTFQQEIRAGKHTQIAEKKNPIRLKLSTLALSFGLKDSALASLMTPYSDTLKFYNSSSHKGHVYVRSMLSAQTGCFSVGLSAKQCIVPANDFSSIDVTVEVDAGPRYADVLEIYCDNSPRYFVTLQHQCESSSFGVPISDLVLLSDHGRSVPAVLVTLRKAMEKKNAFLVPDLFRAPANQTELRLVKAALQRNAPVACADIHVLPSLVKIWCRQLPKPLLSALSLKDLTKGKSTQGAAYQALTTIQNPERDITLWLLDLLTEVTLHQDANQMTERAMATVFAPNLVSISTSLPLAESVSIGQTAVEFLRMLLNYESDRKRSKK